MWERRSNVSGKWLSYTENLSSNSEQREARETWANEGSVMGAPWVGRSWVLPFGKIPSSWPRLWILTNALLVGGRDVGFCCCCCCFLGGVAHHKACVHLMAQMVKNLTWLPSLSREDPWEKGMATHSNVLAWRILWTEWPGGLHTDRGVAKSWTQLSN